MRFESAIASASRRRRRDWPIIRWPRTEYWQLLAHIRSTEPKADSRGGEFINRHADTYIADRLRFDWSLWRWRAAATIQAIRTEAAQLCGWWTDDPQFRCYRGVFEIPQRIR